MDSITPIARTGWLIVWLVISAVLSTYLTTVVRSYAVRKSILDHPSHRSLHAEPVPRGGGFGFIIATATVWTAAYFFPGGIEPAVIAGLGVPLAILGFTGWRDDRASLGIHVRLVLQLAAAASAIAILGPVHQAAFMQWRVDASYLAIPLTLLWILWMVNLYNFMDGIDGIASVQGIVAAAALALWFLMQSDPGSALVCVAVAGSVLGFLRLNWPPARVFMGDSGSLFLGGFFAIIGVVAVTRHDIPSDAVFILLGVFIADASVTLVRRALNRDSWWLPHRTHYYQRAVQAGLSHASVSRCTALLCLCLAAIATARVVNFGPAWWPVCASCVILTSAAIVVTRRERRFRSALAST